MFANFLNNVFCSRCIVDGCIIFYFQVKLIVIDNIAFHLRHDWSDMSSRARIMNEVVLRLSQLTKELNLAVRTNTNRQEHTCDKLEPQLMKVAD